MKNFTPQSIFSFIVFSLFTFLFWPTAWEYRVKITSPIDRIHDEPLSQYQPVRKSSESTEIGAFSNYILAMKGLNDANAIGFENVESSCLL